MKTQFSMNFFRRCGKEALSREMIRLFLNSIKMIPIIYKLREGIRFEDRGDSFFVISEIPLNVVQASTRAVKVLQLCDGNRTLSEIALAVGIAREEQVFKICDYFNRKAVLETSVTENPGYFPAISIIIPTRDRAQSVVECLESVYSQDYPPNEIEIIVVDDGSLDETQKLVSAFPCTVLTNPESRGQSYCRNLGARQAKNEILAFLDDDCVAGRTWLRDLTPCFQWDGVGAVGGYVDGYSNQSLLDRYEKEFSRLNLGKYILRGVKDPSTFFIPTCNMLVRKKAFDETGGIRETLHIGEDVDFCWRMRDAGWRALYIPAGMVRHKHRNTIPTMLQRRADYGASEALLCALHPQKHKTLQWRTLAAAAFLGWCLAIVFMTLYPLAATGVSFLAETAGKAFRLHRKRVRMPFGKVCFSVLRIYMSAFYIMSFHLTRYYLVLFFLLGCIFPSLWALALALLLFAASVDYPARRPRLAFPPFFFYYVLDHLSYQLGVLAGCCRAKTFRPYLVHPGTDHDK
jgi:mycofactocin glycosyltransferase